MAFSTELSATLLVTVMVVAVYGQGGSEKTGTTGSIGAYDPNIIGVKIGQIHKSVKFGDQKHLGKNNTMGRNCSFGWRVDIGDSNIFPQNSVVKNYVRIKHNNTFGRGLNLSEDASIRSNNRIGSDFYMGLDSSLSDGNSIGDRVRMLKDSKVWDNTKIMADSILDENSYVNSGCQIGYNVYLGKQAYLNERVKIRDGAVVHAHVRLAQGTTIDQNEVVIPSPSSSQLFEQCAPYDKVPGDSISGDINAVFLKLINVELGKLDVNCRKGKKQTGPRNLPLIKSLYLIQYYGEEGFKSKYQDVSSPDGLNAESNETRIESSKMGGSFSYNVNVNGIKIPPGGNYGGGCFDCSVTYNGVRIPPDGGSGINPGLDNEIHFGQRAKQPIINSEAKRKFMQVLAAELDFKRDVRVKNDTFCSMIEQIQSGKRKVRFDQQKSNIF